MMSDCILSTFQLSPLRPSEVSLKERAKAEWIDTPTFETVFDHLEV